MQLEVDTLPVKNCIQIAGFFFWGGGGGRVAKKTLKFYHDG